LSVIVYFTGSTITYQDLVKESESHIIIFLLFLGLWLLSLGGFGCRSSSSDSSRGSSTSTATSWDRTNLLGTLRNQLFDILASKLSDNFVKLLAIGFNTNRTEKST